MPDGSRGAPSFGRKASLAFGASYIVAGLILGLNVDVLWALFGMEGGPSGTSAAYVLRSAMTIVFPHVVAIAGFILLIVGGRIARRAFIAIALLPIVYAAFCLAVRTGL